MSTLLRDLRYALRMLGKGPGFAVVAIVTLALGIGANTAMFSVVNAVLLKPLPYPEAERLIRLFEKNKHFDSMAVSFPNYADWSRTSHSFSHVAVYRPESFALASGGEPERLAGAKVSASLFPALGVRPALGRVFTAQEDRKGAWPVALLGSGVWRARFGGDTRILGRTLTLDGRSVTIVGILPPGFELPSTPVDLLLPAGLDAREGRDSHYLRAIGRLKPGVTLEMARAEMDAIAKRLEELYPQTNAGTGVFVTPAHEQMVRGIRPTLLVLLVAVGFVLLIACGNIANLLLARLTSRTREIALRAAMGASRWRIARQLLTESLLLTLLGGAAGILVALWIVEMLIAAKPDAIPRLDELGLDPIALAFTAVLSLLTALAFGLAPSLHASRIGLSEAMREGARGATSGRGRTRAVLVISEVALACLLSVGAGLTIASFRRLQRVEPGFRTEGILTAEVSLREARYGSKESVARFADQVLRGLSAIPGEISVAATTFLPLSGNDSQTTFAVEGRPPQPPGEELWTDGAAVTEGYFGTLGIPLLKGRAFSETDDTASVPVVVINETMVRRFFPEGDAVGKRIQINEAWREVVGVVGTVKNYGLDADDRYQTYLPVRQINPDLLTLVVRTDGDPSSLTSPLRRAVSAADPNVPVYGVRTFQDLLDASLSRRRFTLALLGGFASLALLLAAVGVYGVMACAVSGRIPEIGIRMALGARGGDVVRMVVGEGIRLSAIGILVGLAGTFALGGLLKNIVFGVSPRDPMTLATITLLLTAVAGLASLLPALRAAKVDPIVALRQQ